MTSPDIIFSIAAQAVNMIKLVKDVVKIQAVNVQMWWFPSVQMLTNNRIWKNRTVNIGVVSAEDALNYGFR